jgi:tRNA(Ile)-lysidine synthase
MVRRTVSKFLTQFLSDTGSHEIWVACSGGLDSMVLLALVREFVVENTLVLGVIHFNHNLRSESASEELFVAATALKSELPVVIGQARDLKNEILNSGNSLETEARNHRYAFFQRLLKIRPQAVILTAHNATDQVETIMMNLMRGTGLRGLKGIPRKRGRIGRPLLEITRAQLADYVNENRIDFREDPSNDSLAFSRNRVRHELLPVIHRLGGPGVEARIAGAGLRLAADLKIIDRQLDALWPAVEDVPGGVTVARKFLQQIEVECLPHFIARMIRRAGAVKQVPARVLDELVVLVGTEGERRLSHYDLGAGLVFKGLSEVVFIGRGGVAGKFADLPAYQLELKDYGLWQLPHGLGTIKLSLLKSPIRPDFRKAAATLISNEAKFKEIIAADNLTFPLLLRNRRPGDFFLPLGLAGKSCKLKKFLNSRALNLCKRSRIPLLCNGTGEIIWIVGERLDHRFRVTRDSRDLVELTYIPADGLIGD